MTVRIQQTLTVTLVRAEVTNSMRHTGIQHCAIREVDVTLNMFSVQYMLFTLSTFMLNVLKYFALTSNRR
jgi:hypothetical protein